MILKANGKGFCGGHVARWGPDENPYPDFGDTFEDLYKGTADLFLWPTLYLWEFPKPTISADPRLLHGRRHLPGPADRLLRRIGGRVLPDAAGAEPRRARRAHHDRAVAADELASHHGLACCLAPTLSAQEALEWGLLNKVVPRDQLEETVEEMARKIGQIPLTTSMAVKNSVKRAYELMGMRVHLQVSHILTNMVGAAIRRSGAAQKTHRVRLEAKGFHRGRRDFPRRADVKAPDFFGVSGTFASARAGKVTGRRRDAPRRSRRSSCWRCFRPRRDSCGPSPWR